MSDLLRTELAARLVKNANRYESAIETGRAEAEVERLHDQIRSTVLELDPGESRSREPEIRSMSDIEELEVRFLWRPYIARGKVTLLEGDPGDGKSHLLCTLSAAVSSGSTMPHQDGESWVPIDAGNVLLWAPEDDASDTLKPRLRRANARMENIDIFEGVKHGDEATPVTLADGIDVVAAALERKKYSLFILDTLTTVMGANVDINRPNEGGEVMRKLKTLAERHDVAIVATRHLKKSKSGSAIYDGLGSVAIAGTVRSIIRVAVDNSDRRVRALFHVKSNCSEEGMPLGYELDGHQLHWTGRPSFDLAQARAEYTPKNTGPTKRQQAAEWLRAELKGGPKKSNDIRRRAESLGYSNATLDRAKTDIDAEAAQHEKAWWWFLPGSGFEDQGFV